MTLIKLVCENFIDISHPSKTSLLYIDWKGHQTIESIHRGCEHILDVLRQTGAGSIFNDNTHLLGIWNDAAQWVATDWFPRMKHAGLCKFAWLYSPSRLSQISTNQTMELMEADAFGVKLFHNKAEALAWLNLESSTNPQILKPRPRVLVVEDNQDCSEIFHSMLHTMGCLPEVAGNAAAGLEMARHFVPDLIFCDIGLPGDMNGYDFANAVRADNLLKDIPLIAVSGQANVREDSVMNAGFERVYPKPIKFNDISQALARFLVKDGLSHRTAH